MFVVATSLQAPLVAHPSEPVEPLKVWSGVASWYGPGFQGRPTANGEDFDMLRATAAHRTIPMGSWVRVVNPKSGRARVVRINDRGPFIEGREIDLSYQVAQDLGFSEQGLARVRIELLEVPQGRWSTKPLAD
jgi:rare lipoprotein A